MKIDWMLTILAVGVGIIAISIWKAQRRPDFDFFDLLMENGRVSRIAFWFMAAGAVSTWVIIDLEIKGKLDPTMFGLWLTAWVGPLIAKMVFGRNDMSGMTLTTTKVVTESKQAVATDQEPQ